MKHQVKLLLSAMLYASILPVHAQDVSVKVWRLYNPSTGEHLYTASQNERDILYDEWWNIEGTGWITPDSSAAPVYRIYNPYSGEHLYTVDRNECSYLAAAGWIKEGISFYSDDEEKVPVYRLYNPYSGAHHFTTDLNEYSVLPSCGWLKEGTAWYASETGTNEGEKVHSAFSIPNMPYISQYAIKAWMGCEGAAALQGMHALGYAQNISLKQFLDEMPRASVPSYNPHEGFAGSPYSGHDAPAPYAGIFPDALTPYIERYCPAQDISGSSTSRLLKQVQDGHPVVVYVTKDFQDPLMENYAWGPGVKNAHVMTLYGYDGNGNLHIMDPVRGDTWVSRKTFDKCYNPMHYAVSIG